MTKILLAISIFILSVNFLSAQDLMKIGEVFDFNIGDKFQYRAHSNEYTTPNANRYTIIDKWFSESSDTVFYVRKNESYSTTYFDGNPPHLEYHFQTSIDTVFCTNLNSLISEYVYWTPYDSGMYSYDTLIYTSDYFCDLLINGYSYYTQSFEGEEYSREFGKGIGLKNNHYSYPSEFTGWDYSLFYYEKDGIACGTPDTADAIDYIEDTNIINIYPNPADDYFQIDFPLRENYKLTIYTINGKFIDNIVSNGNKLVYNCAYLKQGIYFITVKTSSSQYHKKLTIK